MGLLWSITELAEFTGIDRKTASQRLSILRSESGPGGTIQYDTAKALPTLLCGRDRRGVQNLELADKREIMLGVFRANMSSLLRKLEGVTGDKAVKKKLAELVKDAFEEIYEVETAFDKTNY